MYQVFVMYPNSEGATFDYDYYVNTHMKLVEEKLKPYGLQSWKVIKGLSGGGDAPAPYLCVGMVIFDTADGYDRGGAVVGPVLRDDIPNFTNVTPVRLVAEIIA